MMKRGAVLQLGAALLVAVLSILLLPREASALDSAPNSPSGSVRIKSVQVAFIGSGSVGGGTLRYGGRSYRFTVSGLGIGGIGVSQLDATGSVYNLKSKHDFAGLYAQIRTGWAIGDQGRGKLWLQNPNGVILRLNARREGLSLTLGADGMAIAFAK